MRKFKINIQIKSLRLKFAFWTGLILLVCIGGITAQAVTTARTQAKIAAENSALAQARSMAYLVKAQIEVAMDTSRTTSVMLGAGKEQGLSLNRGDINNMLEQLIAKNPDFVGVGNLWEPNALDALDSMYESGKGSDEKGRFLPYWSRGDDGKPKLDLLVDYDNADWYLLPKTTGKEAVTEPYFYPVNGQDVLMTTLSSPIMANNKFYGMVGIDISLAFLQKLADEMDIYDKSGQLFLFTDKGTLVAATGNPEAVGKNFKELENDGSADGSYIASAEEQVKFEDTSLEIFVPIHIGRSDQIWTAQIVIPLENIMAESNRETFSLAGIGILLSIVGIAFIMFIADRMVRPLKQFTTSIRQISEGDLQLISDEMNALADGDFTRSVELKTPTIKIDSVDEIGQLGTAFNVMIERLHGTAEVFTIMAANLKGIMAQLHVMAGNINKISGQVQTTANESSHVASQIAATIGQVAKGTTVQNEAITRTVNSVDQVARAIDGVAKGAQEQAQAVNTASTVTAQMSSAIHEISASAESQAKNAAETVQTTHTSVEVVEETVKGMEKIKAKMDFSAQKVQEMGKRSEEI
jgi:methyl-accepting chemotaxis protein